MANLDEWKTVIGEAFKISRPEQDDKTNFTVKSYVSGKYVNCTLWDNSHAHVKLKNGDAVIVNGKVKNTPKKDGDGFWVNLSVGRIGIIAMDAGVDTRTDESGSEAAADAEEDPDVL